MFSHNLLQQRPVNAVALLHPRMNMTKKAINAVKAMADKGCLFEVAAPVNEMGEDDGPFTTLGPEALGAALVVTACSWPSGASVIAA